MMAAVNHDPYWADKLDQDIAIVDYAHFKHSRIARLSKRLHFLGSNETGWSANFENCQYLENACGNFARAVSFHGSGIKCIEALNIDSPNNQGLAVDFSGCMQLKILTGQYPGAISACGSGISRIRSLRVKNPTRTKNRNIYEGKLGSLLNCNNLKSWIPSNSIQADSKDVLNPEDFLLDKELKEKLLLSKLLSQKEILLD